MVRSISLKSAVTIGFAGFFMAFQPIAAVADDNDTAGTESAALVGSVDAYPEMEVRRIGLIDIDGVLRASSGTVRVRELLDEQRLAFQKEFTQRETELQQVERQLMDSKLMLSQEAFDQQLAEFQANVTELQRQIQYRRQSLDIAFQEAQNDLRNIALDIVKEIARERTLDLVLVRDAALIYVPGLNISDAVLERLNERTKNARIEIKVDSDNGS